MHGQSFIASALQNLVEKPSDRPDLIIHQSSCPVREYDNPSFFPGMYPTLYPYGTGGFEDPTHPVTVSFQKQANYYLDIAEHSFQYHHSFIFVVVNILQRRAAHLHTSFTVSQSHFKAISESLLSISPHTLSIVANHLKNEGKVSHLSAERKKVFDLLSEVTTVSARLPGSQASKIFCHNEIHDYCGLFGMPILFLTVNPNPTQSPMFQLFFWDQTINSDNRFPVLVSCTEHALRLAKNPVAAADFFKFSIQCLFEFLFGWNFRLA